ncbi:uncharacterized protein SAPINGB_P002379 [Magnusiomyces paraingens]|uniref:Uncharacterized protein n=1 Tax=Magnusiomyces paraingens TaxID=2606893 RepID=A0A5E8BDW1_9ASCO|nr:uncharacterized protein SAPINGB_P002379 [Saprochaete ingens]VVT49659.1 unnamed protein product [Saprochaete ingens]
MARLSVPPLTRTLLGLLVFFSLSMAVIRYYLLIDSIHHHHQAEQMLRAALGKTSRDTIPTSSPQSPENNNQHPALSEPLKFSAIAVPFLVMVPGMSVLRYPWVFATATFAEDHILSFLLTAAILLVSGKYCEHMWGSAELARFVAIQTLVPNIVVLLITLAAHSYDPLCQLPGCAPPADIVVLPDRWVTINGGTAFVAGFAVALKQLVPEHTVALFRGAIRIRVARLPALYLLIMAAYGLFLETWSRRSLTALVGFFSAWIYLRFFRVSQIDPLLPLAKPSEDSDASVPSPPSSGLRRQSSNLHRPTSQTVCGDAADSFALAHFFPDPLASLVAAVGAVLYPIFVRLRILPSFSPQDVGDANVRAALRGAAAGTAGTGSPYAYLRQGGAAAFAAAAAAANSAIGSSVRAQTERRRAMALRALDSKINSPLHSSEEVTVVRVAAPSVTPSDTPRPESPAPDVDLARPNRAVLPPKRPDA